MATWYVRPNTSHNGTRNGTSYATAWGGWSEIVWGAGGVLGGDTLYICGAHSYSSVIAVGAHTGSSESTRCTIRGDYTDDPGSITFGTASNYYLENSRNWTTVRGVTVTAGVSNCLFLSGGTDCVYTDNTFLSQSSIPLSFWDGASFSRVSITHNTFRGASATASIGATISRFVSAAAALRTTTDVTISNNIFEDCAAGRAVIHFRTEDDTDIGSVMSGIECNDNTFTGCTGVLIQFFHGHATASIGGTATIARNVARNCRESAATAGNGGFISAGGFSSCRVFGNEVYGIQGAAGFCNVFYGQFQIFGNKARGLTTTTIDGNGVLFDHGASGTAWGNDLSDMPGKDGTANSGVGIMVLDATNVTCTGNLIVGCKWGIHLGAQLGGQSCKILNNTIADCADGAIYTSSTADLANCEIKNNIFIGDGYSVYDQTAVAWSAENYNYFHGFASGTSNHTLGANSSTDDPLLNASYRPMAGSPVIGAGTYIPGARHMGGKRLASTPDIGAYPYFTRNVVLTRGT